jgi:hypothetical protein
MQNVNILHTATVVLPAANRGATLLLQNQSDVPMRIAIGSNVASLSASVGLLLQPQEFLKIDPASASQAVSAIHAATGASKVLHWQLC